MIDKLKKSFIIANRGFITAIKFFKWIGIYFAKLAWSFFPPLILWNPLSIFCIPIFAYWCIFWMAYFFDDWLTEDPELLM